MKFRMVNRVPVIEEKGVSYFYDTGLPCADMPVNAGVQQFFGIPGLRARGVAALKRYTKIDYANSEIITSHNPIPLDGGKMVPLEVRPTGWLVKMTVGGVEGLRYIDTGAAYSYVPGMWNGFDSLDSVKDCGFKGEPWSTEAHAIPCMFDGCDFVVGCGNVADNLEHVPPEGVIGYDFFKNFTIVVDRKNGQLHYRKNLAMAIELTVGNGGTEKVDYRDKMINLYQSSEYQELSAYYAKKSAFGVLGIARRENRHSNMIAWLLDPKGGHGFGKNPIRSFIRTLAIAKSKYIVNRESYLPDVLLDAFITGNFDIERVEVAKEVSIADVGKRTDEDGRIDLVLKIGLSIGDEHKILPVVIENKVDSEEHKVRTLQVMQTEAYHEWAEKKFSDGMRYFSPLFVFLTPDGSYQLETGNGEIKNCQSKLYLRINYQSLVDYVIAPLLKSEMADDTRSFINEYLRCLSFESLNSEERKNTVIMALAPHEKELLHSFWEKNEKLLLAAMYALSEDSSSGLDDEARELILKTVDGVSRKDRTKYKIGEDGELMQQGRMVLEVVKRYVSQNDNVTFLQLQDKFPDALAKNKFGVVRVFDPDMAAAKHKRYFVTDDERIKLTDGTEVVVSREWGRAGGTGNIPAFVANAIKLGFDIKEIAQD